MTLSTSRLLKMNKCTELKFLYYTGFSKTNLLNGLSLGLFIRKCTTRLYISNIEGCLCFAGGSAWVELWGPWVGPEWKHEAQQNMGLVWTIFSRPNPAHEHPCYTHTRPNMDWIFLQGPSKENTSHSIYGRHSLGCHCIVGLVEH